jgi:hypothetical protein
MFIRSLQPADLPVLASIWQEQIAVIHPLQTGFSLLVTEIAVALEQALHDPRQQIYIAEESGNLLGFLWLDCEGNARGKVVAAGVDMHGGGARVGTALWGQAKGWFAAQGVRQVNLPRQSAVADAFWFAQGALDRAGGLSITL